MRASWTQLPNLLSLSRVPLAAAFLLLYDTTSPALYVTAVSIAITAIATDVADGRLARRWMVTSELGYFLDGIGDKAFYVAVLLVMVRESASGGFLPWLLISREIFLYALRSIDSRRAQNLKRLRSYSLYYALSIRLYFLDFAATGAFVVCRVRPPSILSYGFIFGYLAVVFGYITIGTLARDIAAEA